MRAWLIRSLVALLALVFGASGVVANYCGAAHHPNGGKAAAQLAQVQSAHAHSAKVESGTRAHHGDHVSPAHTTQDGDGLQAQFALDDVDTTGMDAAACSKCCGICTLVTTEAPPVSSQAIFKVSGTVFAVRTDLWSGAPRRVDPGIPKIII
jgi:hypothetical protein